MGDVRYYREQALETIARNTIKAYNPTLLMGEPCAIPIEDIIEKSFGLTVEFQYIRNNGRILGETVFEDAPVAVYDKENNVGYTLILVKKGTIIIDASLLSDNNGRLRFTFAHELAHWIIHNEYYSKMDMNAAMKLDAQKSSDSDKTIERQADFLAGSILMPSGQVKKAFYRSKQTRNEPVEYLATLFQVSKQAMQIKLKSCGLI